MKEDMKVMRVARDGNFEISCKNNFWNHADFQSKF